MQIMPAAVSDSARFDRKEEFVGKFTFSPFHIQHRKGELKQVRACRT